MCTTRLSTHSGGVALTQEMAGGYGTTKKLEGHYSVKVSFIEGRKKKTSQSGRKVIPSGDTYRIVYVGGTFKGGENAKGEPLQPRRNKKSELGKRLTLLHLVLCCLVPRQETPWERGKKMALG